MPLRILTGTRQASALAAATAFLYVLDPHTGGPATAQASVPVVGTNLTWADAYATAAVAMGERAWLCTLDGHERLVIAADGTSRQTPSFPSLSRPGSLKVR
jgi:thiamine biosynthesis lipoprotein